MIAEIEEVRELPWLPEDWSRLMRHQEPATVAVLEYVRHESIEAQRIAILP
jgi:hypothetical protein